MDHFQFVILAVMIAKTFPERAPNILGLGLWTMHLAGAVESNSCLPRAGESSLDGHPTRGTRPPTHYNLLVQAQRDRTIRIPTRYPLKPSARFSLGLSANREN